VLLDAVERVVRSLPGLERAVVVAKGSAEWGQVPVVVVDVTPGLELSELRAIVATALGRAAAPARIVQVESVPMLASGKPDRVALAGLVAVRGTT
jgi:O-succinylbenzoic acid--CoA ligase